ncbi:putative hydrophobic protein (TIGR00271 family) [Ilumatobacter fluminis]|uniref:Putative hydrophobic protein (TIGR00271 family) n=1 Tax=Ilumatobacter fluminis TaxID=467091 RepID=A0A4R7I5T8_9ACTN|nr:DUF389 domain-containing protein [Ilumatobacter fluminis]TDT18176.1 putative hydrophobic protein (TIGR00271 family) [Ilumatobacter fluminis]
MSEHATDPPAAPSGTRWWFAPVTWAATVVVIAGLVSLTAPSSSRPPERIAIGLLLGGSVLLWAAFRDRTWPLLPIGLATVVGGGALLRNGQAYIEVVTQGAGVLVLAIGVWTASAAWRRLGRVAALMTLSIFAGAAALVVSFDRELLSLSIGIVELVAATVVIAGINRARLTDDLRRSSGLVAIALLGLHTIDERTADPSSDHSVRDKVLYEGADRERRIFRFVILMGLASTIASLGIIADSTAVVIGAMLVAPLLVPLMGVSLSLVVGWRAELRRSAVVAGLGVLVAIGMGYLVSAVFGRGTDVATNAEIASRVSPTLLDLAIALAAGAAGAFALSRRDASDALPGVAVAIALVPPLAVVGVAAQLGAAAEAVGALLLFGTNALAIVAMGSATFVVAGTAETEASRPPDLGGWTLWVGVFAVVIVGLLVSNTEALNEAGAQDDLAARVVETWIDDAEYELVSVDVDGEAVTVMLSGPAEPDDLDDLGDALDRALGGVDTVDVQISITESATITIGDDS